MPYKWTYDALLYMELVQYKDHVLCQLNQDWFDIQIFCHSLCHQIECGGQKTGPYGYLASPNHPKPYPHQQVNSNIFHTVKHVQNWLYTVEMHLKEEKGLLFDFCLCLSVWLWCFSHLKLCTWRISVEKNHVITLSFRNFSLETQDVCEFDYVEVHDSADTGAGRVLGRWDQHYSL